MARLLSFDIRALAALSGEPARPWWKCALSNLNSNVTVLDSYAHEEGPVALLL